MYAIETFTIGDMTQCGTVLRRLDQGAKCMQDVAGACIDHLYENLADAHGGKACALARFFKTHSFSKLPAPAQAMVRGQLKQGTPDPRMKCLTLLATRGEDPAWNSPKDSKGHQFIPLYSEEMVAQAPMIANLVLQFGLELRTVLKPDPALLLDLAQKQYNVFFIPQAKGSPYVPSQSEFVVPRGIQSVIGFGGMLSQGDLFAVILFTKVNVPREAAGLFKTVALSLKVAVLPFEDRVFPEDAARP